MRRSFVYLMLLVALAALLFTLFSPRSAESTEVGLGTVLEKAKAGELERIEVQGDSLIVYTTKGEKLTSRKEASSSLMELLAQEKIPTGSGGVQVVVKGSGGWGSWLGLLVNFLPLLFFGALLFFMMRQAQGTNTQALSFGRSRARLFTGNRPTVTFGDVAGVDEAKEELREVVEFLRYSERFLALGARIPRGVLLVGPPGTGKTLLARAVAGEANVPFYSISGSEFVEMFVGVGASRVRDLFDQAKRNAPCIVFVDEIDAVGRHRGAGLGGGHDEREQTLNQILVEMDGFDTSTNVIVLAATNRPDILDPALLRPGRFDRRVVLDLPDINGRKAVLEVHTRGKPMAEGVDLLKLAKETPGFSGADLANLVNEAAILTARREKKAVAMGEFEEAIDRVIAGPERRSRLISAREKEITAYHEAGHALVAKLLPNADPVHKISIVARGLMGGYTRLLPAEDRHLLTRSQFQDMLATALGGRAAEELVFNEMTTGSENDLEHATNIARQMVTRYGMSSRPSYEEVPISAVLEQALEGKLASIEIYGNDLLVRTREGRLFRSRKEEEFSLVEFLRERKVTEGPDGVQVYVKSSNMLDGLGPRTFGKREELIFLGKEIAEQRNYSDKVAEEIDEEVKRFVDQAYKTAKDLLTQHRDKLDRIAQKLTQVETLEGEALDGLFKDGATPEYSPSSQISQAPQPGAS